MRKALLAMALVSTLAMGGCATTPGGPIIDPVKVTQVQETAKQICGFLPTVSTVANIIATFAGASATVDLVTQAASGICAAITAKSARRGASVPKYRGVVIQGSFVR